MDASEYLKEIEASRSKRISELTESFKHSARFIDQVIVSLTIGILGFSIAFKEKFIYAEGNLLAIKISWSMLLVSVLLVVINNYINSLASRRRVSELDGTYRKKSSIKTGEEQKPWHKKYDSLLPYINGAICLCFLIGLSILVCFAIGNLD